LGADPEVHQHNTFLPGERGGDVVFYNPSAKTMKAIFDDYAGDHSLDEYKGLISKLKERKFSYLVFSLRHPFGVSYFE